MEKVMYCYGKHAALLNQACDNVVKLNTVKEILRKIEEVQEEEKSEDFFVMSLGYKNLIDKEEEFEAIFSSIKNTAALIYCTDEEVWDYINTNSLFNPRVKTIKQFEILKKAMIYDDLKALEKMRETEVSHNVFKPVFQRRPEVKELETKEVEQDVLEFINSSLEKETQEQKDDYIIEESVENVEYIEEDRDFIEEINKEDELRIIAEIVSEEIADSLNEEIKTEIEEILPCEDCESKEIMSEPLIEQEGEISEIIEEAFSGNKVEIEESIDDFMKVEEISETEEAVSEADFVTKETEIANDEPESESGCETNSVIEETYVIIEEAGGESGDKIESTLEIEEPEEAVTEVEADAPEVKEREAIINNVVEEEKKIECALSEEEIIRSLIEDESQTDSRLDEDSEEEVSVHIEEEELFTEAEIEEEATLNETVKIEDEIVQSEEEKPEDVAEDTVIEMKELEAEIKEVKTPVTQSVYHDGEEFKFTPGNFFIE